jgi:hypothetical protein
LHTDTAFALAGLGGFNAHGAGFLQAARNNGFTPGLITATSGQILVLASYLEGVPDLKAGLVDAATENNPFAQLQVALFGYSGIFRPAYAEAATRFLTPPSFGESVVDILADRLLPAQQYVPVRPDATIAAVVDRFNGSDIGVVFNAYDPGAGRGILYGNDAARAQLETTSKIPIPAGADLRYARGGADEARLHPITPEAVKAALWLSLYGFDGSPGGRIDGAYFRSCILSELHSFARVIVARPLAAGWIGRRPGNWFEVQDWQCEMWFSVGYKAEVQGLRRINALLRDGMIKDTDRFRHVDLHEIAPPTPAGYFNYFVEHTAVFDAALDLGDALFRQLADPARVREAFAATG